MILPKSLRAPLTPTEKVGEAHRAAISETHPHFEMTVDYYDDITTTCEVMKRVYDEGFMSIAENASQVIAESIQRIYDEGGVPEWRPVSAWWLAYKAEHGYDTRTMHQTNMLWGNVHELDAKLNTMYNPAINDFTVTGLEAAFANTNYVWIHEISGVGPQHITRPFIFQGLELGLGTLRSTGELINNNLKEVIDAQYTGIGGGGTVPPMVIPPEKIATAIGEDVLRNRRPVTIRLAGRGVVPSSIGAKYSIIYARFHTQLLSLMWWFFPPSRMLGYYGASMDLLSLASGKLLEDRYLTLWLQAYIRGMAGARLGVPLTEKQSRRRFRHGLYGRRR